MEGWAMLPKCSLLHPLLISDEERRREERERTTSHPIRQTLRDLRCGVMFPHLTELHHSLLS